MMYCWVAELLSLFGTEHVLLCDFDVTVRGEKIDSKRHCLDKEVKAITYHKLKVERVGDGWLDEVIVDL